MKKFFFISFYIGKSTGFVKVWDFQFLMDLYVLEFPEHNFTISRKCLSVCMCDQNFVASAAEDLMHRVSSNLIYGVILT